MPPINDFLSLRSRLITRKLLPIGIQTFSRLCEDDAYYVDKTRLLLSLIRGGSRYFLSRPRRFGKSLLVSTLKELFEGNEPLFEGLYIHKAWDWSRRSPVVRLDFSIGGFENPDRVAEDVNAQLRRMEEDAAIDPRHGIPALRSQHLIRELRRKTGERVVVLIDEYDKPNPTRLARQADA
ncbi:MAG: AAA family ATPase [Thiotrichales bacterium]|nr:AAA family ATPase [Thiotrichales bacterium]